MHDIDMRGNFAWIRVDLATIIVRKNNSTIIPWLFGKGGFYRGARIQEGCIQTKGAF
jgi:hypothetical protein